jgi:hypothetical protein
MISLYGLLSSEFEYLTNFYGNFITYDGSIFPFNSEMEGF